MASTWRNLLPRDPLTALTLLALVPRVLAAFFSGGYFAHDDHFLVIEAAGSWADGSDYNNWLPWHQEGEPRPSGHSFFYVGFHYLLLVLLKGIGITHPKVLMVFVRLVHAVWSLIVVRTGYRIALKLSGDEGIAWRTGLLLALFYFMPFLAVRNLVEVACIPFLMLGAWRLVRDGDKPALGAVLVAGIWFGLAINVRFQTLFMSAGAGLGLLLLRDVRRALVFGAGVLLPLVVFQGGIDLFIWDRPFAELTEYVMYNMAHSTTYGVLPWYNFLLLLAGVFIPPLSLGVLFGFFRRWKPLPVWLALFAFLAFHSWHPNKQERFIFPLLPLYFVLGYTAWEQWRLASAWWQGRPGLQRGLRIWTWSLNLLLLVVLTFSYSKRSRVEAMTLLHGRTDVQGLVVEDSAEGEAPMTPLFYLGNWNVTVVPWTDPQADLAGELDRYPDLQRPNYVVFIGEEDLDARVARTEAAMGPLELVGKAQPGLVDQVVHWLNPVNRNEVLQVMRTTR